MALHRSQAPELDAVEWLNTEGVDLEQGNYLLDFWSSSCLDCVDTLPEMQELHANYPVEVLGIHTPEFEFEQRPENVENAVERRGVDYPVALDRGRDAWNSYGNSYWPGNVLVKDGEVVWKSVGKADPATVEEAVSEAVGKEKRNVVNPVRRGGDVSSKTRLGYERCSGVNGGGSFRGKKDFSVPRDRRKETIYLDGAWRQQREHLEAVKDAALFYHHLSRKTGVVAHPGGGIRDVEVLVNGDSVPGRIAGEDLEVEGARSYLRIADPGVYELIDAEKEERDITLLPEPGTRIYSLDFM